MRTSTKLATLGVAMTLGLTPAASLASPGHGKPTTKGGTPTTKEHAYGKFCQSESKTHVKGEKGTAFSRCVTDLAKLDSGKTHNPHVACKDESKTHMKGEKGTAFSRCVVAANRLLQSERKKKS
jgi:hypothetical protein